MFSCEIKEKELLKIKVLQTNVSLADMILIRKHKRQGDITCPLFFRKGSLTVEAALVLPLFLLACLTLLSFIDVMRNVINKQIQQQEYLRSAAVYANLLPGAAQRQEGDCITLDYVYPERLPVGGFGFKKVFVRQRSKVHLFTGYDDSRGDIIKKGHEYVYVTEYGDVYHRKRNCQFINVFVDEVSGKGIDRKRNKEGKKYRKCSVCAKGYTRTELKNLKVYITDYGVKYHVRPNCRELTRTVQVIRIDQVGQRTSCRLCG